MSSVMENKSLKIIRLPNKFLIVGYWSGWVKKVKLAEKLKSREMKDEGWKMNDESWKMKDEGWKMKEECWKMKD